MKRAKRSGVWDSFIQNENNDEVTCKLCNAVMKYNSSTSAMQYHLRVKHANVASSSSGTGVQPTLPSMITGRRCDARRTEEITQKICVMVEKDILPISVVNGEGFQELLRYFECVNSAFYYEKNPDAFFFF